VLVPSLPLTCIALVRCVASDTVMRPSHSHVDALTSGLPPGPPGVWTQPLCLLVALSVLPCRLLSLELVVALGHVYLPALVAMLMLIAAVVPSPCPGPRPASTVLCQVQALRACFGCWNAAPERSAVFVHRTCRFWRFSPCACAPMQTTKSIPNPFRTAPNRCNYEIKIDINLGGFG
jgi:hypothetical protein